MYVHCVLDIIPFCNLKIYFNILLVLLIQPWDSFCFHGIHVHYCSFGWKNWNLIMKNIKTIEIILQILNSHFLYSSIWEQTYKISEDDRDLKEWKHLCTQHKQMIPYVTCINISLKSQHVSIFWILVLFWVEPAMSVCLTSCLLKA